VPFTGIELAVTASALRGSGDRASVAVVVEGRGDRELDLFLAAAPANGRIEAYKRGALKPAGRGSGSTLMQTTAKLDLKPGRYQLRVAALREDTGARGSVLHTFEVPDFSKEDLAISGVTLVDTQRERAPTTRRTFTQSDSFDISAEVYWKRGMTQPVTVATTVANDRGEEVFRQEGVVVPAERPRLGVDLGVTIDLGNWAPGLYRLAVEATTKGGKLLAAKRELTFTVSDR